MKAVIKTKARGVTKAKSAKEAGGAAEVKAAEEAPRIAKRSSAAIRRGSPKGPAPPPAGMTDNRRFVRAKPSTHPALQKRTPA